APGPEPALRLHPRRAADRITSPGPPLGRGPHPARRPDLRARARLPPAHASSGGCMSVADFQPVIGLEVHGQLLTRSKIFCGCSTEFGAPPNANTCAVCLGMPGVLPVLNEKVVEFAVRAGRALECKINPVSIWARKNYFYPDLPKGYQISQYDLPLCEHGALEIHTDDGPRRIRILRIHLEEDAGKNVHDAGGGESLVDLNRSGVPLVEIVSEPDLRTSAEAVEYLKGLRDVLVYLGVNDGNLEEGSFRCD